MRPPQSFAALLLIARFAALVDCRNPWENAFERRVTIPAPVSVAAAQNWDGNDGTWSSFAFQVGTPAQIVTLGRTFFQEAYVIADYDRGNFSVSQCKWEANSQQAIVPILAPALLAEVSSNPSAGSGTAANGTTTNEESKPTSAPIGAIVGGVIGGIVALAVGVYLLYHFCIKPRRHAAEAETAATAAAVAANATKKESPATPAVEANSEFFKPELAGEVPERNEVDGGKNQWHQEVDGGKNTWHSEVDGGKNQWHAEVDGGKNQWHVEADGRPVEIYEMPAEEVASELRGEGGVPESQAATLSSQGPSPQSQNATLSSHNMSPEKCENPKSGS
ncbi:hypothetical protein M7I_4442 [Glarea lozoyensis 74030]|uniref:Uncharacterized protein n=1 Tax=Glarea lozoyensis (strain ATCC 74030 / MF5533) TaxID=1104152 RepID=H0EP72_GLAL7|nr:hypothetical protein M7I_4442 [Glarea lozoyensis 74030]